jgi:hypothetical protein
MRLFGDPKYPRRNIGTGALLLALTSFRLGNIYERIFTPAASRNDYIDLAIWLVLAVLAVIDVRLGIAALPPDPKDRDVKPTGVDRSAV